MKGKKAALSTGMVGAVLLTVIALIIVFSVLGETAEDVKYAADNLTNENYTGRQAANVFPLISFFKPKGIITLAVIAGVVLVIIGAVLKRG